MRVKSERLPPPKGPGEDGGGEPLDMLPAPSAPDILLADAKKGIGMLEVRGICAEGMQGLTILMMTPPKVDFFMVIHLRSVRRIYLLVFQNNPVYQTA